MFCKTFTRRICQTALGLTAFFPLAAHAACDGNNALKALQHTNPATYENILTAAKQVPNGEGIFWKVEAPGVAPSYLLGTKHSADRPIGKELRLARKALQGARLLFVELSPEETAEMETTLRSDPTLFMDMAGGTLANNIPPTLTSRAKDVFSEYALPPQAADRIQPWFLQMLMAQPPCAVAAQAANPDGVMDKAIAQMAKDNGVAVRGLERWEDQLDIFRTMSAHDAKAGLIYMIESHDDRNDDHATLSDLYEARRIAEIWEFSRWRFETSNYDFETSADAHMEKLQRTLVTDRNIEMGNNTRAEVKKGGVVVAVGALHLIGESGLVAAFKREGYNVTRLD
ncbi:MAG: TraB/GumN family protein [Pikeienuella sp.]